MTGERPEQLSFGDIQPDDEVEVEARREDGPYSELLSGFGHFGAEELMLDIGEQHDHGVTGWRWRRSVPADEYLTYSIDVLGSGINKPDPIDKIRAAQAGVLRRLEALKHRDAAVLAAVAPWRSDDDELVWILDDEISADFQRALAEPGTPINRGARTLYTAITKIHMGEAQRQAMATHLALAMAGPTEPKDIAFVADGIDLVFSKRHAWWQKRAEEFNEAARIRIDDILEA